jgi:RNA polymerase sigma-70 factor (ECF subfamily)
MDSDGDLVRQAVSGRTHAYEELVRRWVGRVTALCHAKVGCAAAAEDLAQDAFLKAYRSLRTLDEPERFGGWLCRIALHGCLNWLKRADRRLIPFSNLGPDHQPTNLTDESAESSVEEFADELAWLRREVAALPAECREVVTLFYHQKLTYGEMAQMLGVSPATINARLTRARMTLRRRLDEQQRSESWIVNRP